jgi:hypothetical protein
LYFPLQVGDCLRTEDGPQTVKSAERRLANEDDMTYTVEVAGSNDLIVVGGVVTHAKPQHSHAKARSAMSGLNAKIGRQFNAQTTHA